MDDDTGPSQVTQVVLRTKVSRRKNNREWNEKDVQHLLNICKEKYWEYNRQSFKEKNQIEFVASINATFHDEAPRTWQQVQDKYMSLQGQYKKEAVAQSETGAAPLDWKWYQIFDNMYGGTANIREVPHGID